jgi:hypothetical protein
MVAVTVNSTQERIDERSRSKEPTPTHNIPSFTTKKKLTMAGKYEYDGGGNEVRPLQQGRCSTIELLRNADVSGMEGGIRSQSWLFSTLFPRENDRRTDTQLKRYYFY